jgi:DNA-binding CsgD family transcriptional regulator/tetratricopeptide (TPR) repeat protein
VTDTLPEPELLEREAELATLASLAAAGERGEGSLAVIEGTAGIGKTRLLAEARARAGAGVRVLSARGGELEGDFSFGVVRQLFEPLLAAAGGERRTELFSGAATLAEPLFDPTAVASHQDETDASFAMLHGLYWLAVNVALERPTILAIDDLHWSDTPSLRWLCYLARRLDGLPLHVVVAMRPPEQGRDPQLLTELLVDPAASQIRPGPLAIDSITALVRRRFPDEEPDLRFCKAVEAATRGNPLFVRALVDTVAREGIRPQGDQAHVLLELGPVAVSRAVSLRLARLPEDAGALIEAASILGDQTELRHVAALARLDGAEAAGAASTLVRSDLLRGDDPVEFFHPVVRTAIYDGLDPLVRSDGHRRAAELLLEAGLLPEQAAAHLLMTTGENDEFVVSTLRVAASRSLAQGAPEVAASYLTRALEGASGAQRGEILIELGRAERWVEAERAADHLAAGLELLSDPVRRAEVALDLGNELFYANRLDEAVAVYRRAYDEIDADAHPDLHRWLEAEVVASSLWRADHYPIAAGLMEAFDEQGLSGGLGSDLLLAYRAFYLCRQARDREASIDAARRALASGTLIAHGALGFHCAAFALFSAGLYDEAISAYDGALAASRQRGDSVRAPAILGFRGRGLTLAGNLEAALADLNEGLAAQAPPAALPYVVSFWASALLDRGKFDEAAGVIDGAGFPEPLPLTVHLFFFQLARGRLAVMTGSPDRGVDDLLDLGQRTQLIPFDNPADFPWRRYAVEGLLLLGRTEEAVALAREELEIAQRWGASPTVAACLRTLGNALGGNEGEALLRQAVTTAADSPARIQHARALVDLGAALRRGNKRSEARQALREGADLAYRAGTAALVERANEELAATGARPRKEVVGGIFSLTASERRVAELAAQDKSNKEIAQALFVTVKTVEVHLSSVYRKLAINSRRQLATALSG